MIAATVNKYKRIMNDNNNSQQMSGALWMIETLQQNIDEETARWCIVWEEIYTDYRYKWLGKILDK